MVAIHPSAAAPTPHRRYAREDQARMAIIPVCSPFFKVDALREAHFAKLRSVGKQEPT